MPKKIIKRVMPAPETIKSHRFLKIFGKLLHDPQLWHLTRYSVANAFAIGLFCAFIPVPFQMPLAAGIAILFRANLPLSVALVWITNPITMPVIFGFAYLVGTWILGDTGGEFPDEFTWEWLSDGLLSIWEPFLLGCLICGIVAAALAYVGMRVFWRIHVASQWKTRIKNRLKRNKQTSH
ncbi:DUF2062 domain-containing protein [Pleionea sp. CnH1-48]|uniref:DUF2062 domain-containing protein n=1 Tax=Pleionea sp. CnH1-48 TaxID=2954494 RepID=UPI0020970F5A|nr:DUF2062 domain-containing protein [Pleionea sp. CnH1-48]MCO7225848.1 DUF2062 domain-containing protein [Pleionea sp. CnH1-48]